MTIPWEEGVRDPKRLIALQQSGLVGTSAEDAFDRLIELATELTGAPRGCITLVDAEFFSYKSAVGIPDDAPHSGAIADSFCRYVVGTGQPLVVDDAVNDARTLDNRAISFMALPRGWDTRLKAPTMPFSALSVLLTRVRANGPTGTF